MHVATDRLLMEYGLGVSRPAHSLLAECWMAMNPHKRRFQYVGDAFAGQCLEDASTTDVSVDCFLRTMAALDKHATPINHIGEKPSFVPAPLYPYLAHHGHQLPWKKLGDIRLLTVLPETDGVYCRLVAAPAGKSLASHTHKGSEFSLVLQGAFQDSSGIYQCGDMGYADDTTDHQPQTIGDKDCICLVVQQGDIQFTGRFAGIMNAMYPLVRVRG